MIEAYVVQYEAKVQFRPVAGFTAVEEAKPESVAIVHHEPVFSITEIDR